MDKPRCKHCRSRKMVRHSEYMSVKNGPMKRWICRACGRSSAFKIKQEE